MRYKESVPGWYLKIHLDENGEEASRQEFSKKHAFYKEMIASGIEIEPRFTAEELAANKIKESDQALESLHSKASQRLKEVEYRISAYPPYPEDIEANKKYISGLRSAMASKELVEMPVDPFGN